ncbi:hypothetical protein [Arthrobacter sp. PAMC 25486]|uniref:hypothetical protein n=1 Tax=Arthrobacter sp. PAMC 25486 TaxID=1494608 RepID=UPI00138E2B73|nr:hypothetical protein [Arthrobacter sp. PAMC 25486]
MRELEREKRQQYVTQMTASVRSAVARLETDLDSDNEYIRGAAEKQIDDAKEQLSRDIDSVVRSVEMTVSLRGNGNRSERYTGTPEEFVRENVISKYSSVSVRPSGRMSFPSIDISLHRNLGVTVALETGDMQFYEIAKLKIPHSLKRVSHPLSWLFAYGGAALVGLAVAAVSSLLLLTNIYPSDLSGFLLLAVTSMVLIVPKNYFLPNIQITDEPRFSQKLLKGFAWVLSSLAIGLLGAFIFQWLNLTA